MTRSGQRLRELEGRYVLERHAAGAATPEGSLAAVRAPDGLTVVRRDDAARDAWAALFSGGTAHGADVPGMLVALLAPLADAGVPVLVASTFEADVVLVPAARLGGAASALRAAGHHVELGAR